MTWQRGKTGGIGSGKIWKQSALDGSSHAAAKAKYLHSRREKWRAEARHGRQGQWTRKVRCQEGHRQPVWEGSSFQSRAASRALAELGGLAAFCFQEHRLRKLERKCVLQRGEAVKKWAQSSLSKVKSCPCVLAEGKESLQRREGEEGAVRGWGRSGVSEDPERKRVSWAWRAGGLLRCQERQRRLRAVPVGWGGCPRAASAYPACSLPSSPAATPSSLPNHASPPDCGGLVVVQRPDRDHRQEDTFRLYSALVRNRREGRKKEGRWPSKCWSGKGNSGSLW